MTDRTLLEQITDLPRYMSDEIGMGYCPTGDWIRRDSVLAILDAHTAEPSAPAHIAAAACTCGHCGGLVCCQNCGTPPLPAPDAVREAEGRFAVLLGNQIKRAGVIGPAVRHEIEDPLQSYVTWEAAVQCFREALAKGPFT